MENRKKYFIVTVDTEGDNMWRRMCAKNSVEHRISVHNGAYLVRFQALCEKYGIIPTYLVNWEMTYSNAFVDMAKEKVRKGLLEIGMHMHGWTCPPYYEFPRNLRLEKGGQNPYIIEYPIEIIEQKIVSLTKRLKEVFKIEYVFSHRSGRWFMNETYAKILLNYGYKADCSVTPGVDWSSHVGFTRRSGGANYKGFPETGYEINLEDIRNPGTSGLYEVPVTIRRQGETVSWLRPNGKNLHNMLRLVEDQSDKSYMEFMIHSSELMPYGSPTFCSAYSIEKLYYDMEILFSTIMNQFIAVGLSDYVEIQYLSN